MKIQKDYITFTFDSDLNKQMLFEELIENGQADKREKSVYIPHEEICKLSSIDQQLLELPDPYPFDIKLSQKGLFIQPDFKIELGYFEYNHGKQLSGKRRGCIFSTKKKIDYLLSLDQYFLCEAVEEFNNLEEKDFPSNLIGFSDIKKLSRKAASILDSTLENEEIIAPQKISLKLSKSKDDELIIEPDLEDLSDDQKKEFENKFGKSKSVRTSYNIKNSKGKKIRVPFSKSQKSELKKIKKYNKTKNDIKENIIDSPESIFNPDIIDLSNFSKRVVDIGLYKPKYFPFVSPYKSEWIPGFIIDKGKTQKKILIEDEEKLKQVEELIQKAKSKEKDCIVFENENIPIEEASNIASIARRQLKNPSKPITKTKNQSNVLIIEDNLFEDKYHEEQKQPVPTPESFIHNFVKPPTIRKEINFFEHQKEGIAWLETLYSKSYSGGLLADDMGLGKTIQILSLIDWHNEHKNSSMKPYLIIAPVSLLENWEIEIRKFFKTNLNIEFLHSNRKDKITINYLTKHNIFLTNYETVRYAQNQLIIGQIDWAIVVLDEAQKIKTPGTLVTNAIKSLKADFKIAATGTPVENSMVDLWSIIDFVVPGLLGSAKDFAKKYQKPINKNITDEELNALGSKLRSEIGLYFKRRLKKDVLLDLPEKIERPLTYQMPEIQKKAYLTEIELSKSQEKQQMLTTIMNLKKISDHPFLIGYDWRLKNIEEIINSSAKMKIILEILGNILSKQEKVIIFSEYHETQKILQRVIKSRFALQKVSIINGNTATRKSPRSQRETRQEAVDNFSKVPGFNVIIMSPLAAGVGLNITASNHVIHYSRHWNPAKESQATDRAYRIGQKKDVIIYYPIASLPGIKTFDQILNQLLKRKRNIADVAMFPSAISEVKSEDFSSELDIFKSDNVYDESILTLSDIDSLDPYYFESAIGLIFKQKGFKIIVTPKSNDKGADVVCFSDAENLLIQIKKSENLINDQSVGEVLKSQGYYKQKFQMNFKLIVATNRALNSNAKIISEENNVSVFDRNKIAEHMDNNELRLSEVEKIERKRYTRI